MERGAGGAVRRGRPCRSQRRGVPAVAGCALPAGCHSRAAAPVGFLQELPSYRSVLRRRAAAGDVQERRGNLWGTAAAELRGPQPEEGERGARPLWELPLSIAEKRRIRDSQADIKYSSGWNQWKRTSSKSWKKALKDIKELSFYVELWRHDIHSIEGKFGTGIQSYFCFLRFLVVLNFLMFILMFSFVTLPTVISNYGIFNSSSAKISLNNTGKHLCVPLFSCSYCSVFILNLAFSQGFLEVTVLFYGYYTIDAAWLSVLRYNLPLAYLLTTFACLALSLLWIIKRSVKGFRQNLVHDVNQFQSYCNKVFAGWDFCITDLNAARLKHRSLLYELQTDLEEERLKQKIADRTMKEKLRIFSLRIFINIVVIAVLLACFYCIFRATVFSQENSSGVNSVGFQANLLVQYLPSIVITAVNLIAPQIFSILIRFEDYSPAFEIRLTLLRCVFVRLANIGVLLVSLWSQIQCTTDQCKACGYDYQLYPCWESAVGQEMYKLLIFDFMIIIAVILFVNFPRKMLVTYCSWKPVQWLGLQEFGISDNVLDIVYGQTICWIGTFFSPLLPAIATIKYFIIFYIKKISLIHTCKPASRPIRASSSNFFFLVVLLIGLILAFVPLGVSIAHISSSKACGPFRNFNTSWAVVPETILEFPIGLQKVLFGIASEAFAVPFFMVTCLLMFYLIALAGAHKRVVEQLREQLVMVRFNPLYFLTEARKYFSV
uniref:Transmembrane channel-like protein n=1 Tax=Phasianus colchicus TaxID=9054 RepID=A0A669QM78_PHACC